MIKSGPSKSLTEIEESASAATRSDCEKEPLNANGRIFQHKIRELRIFYLLKTDVGQEWFRTKLDDTHSFRTRAVVYFWRIFQIE